MGKITVPHIHKIEGNAGFWAEVTKKGEVADLKINTLMGLRQIEGLLIGRRYWEVPVVAARICASCSVAHALNACCALEKAFEITVSEPVVLLRKALLANQIIQSHALHLLFMSLADLTGTEGDLDVMKKFPKEAQASLLIRSFALKLTAIIGGRQIHPMATKVGGFTRFPEKIDLAEALAKDYPAVLEAGLVVANLFAKIKYPVISRKSQFLSLVSPYAYPFYQAEMLGLAGKTYSLGDFYSNQIEEDLKNPPIKRVKFQDNPYMPGAIARVSNSRAFLNPQAKKLADAFFASKGNDALNVFHNPFFQAVEIVHFLEETEKVLKGVLAVRFIQDANEVKITKGSGLAAIEAPRGTLFTYLEVNAAGRVSDCNIITPTAQSLSNLEEDLASYLPTIRHALARTKVRKIRVLIRAYDPCISCATE